MELECFFLQLALRFSYTHSCLYVHVIVAGSYFFNTVRINRMCGNIAHGTGCFFLQLVLRLHSLLFIILC